jgi:hypothetical protein
MERNDSASCTGFSIVPDSGEKRKVNLRKVSAPLLN